MLTTSTIESSKTGSKTKRVNIKSPPPSLKLPDSSIRDRILTPHTSKLTPHYEPPESLSPVAPGGRSPDDPFESLSEDEEDDEENVEQLRRNTKKNESISMAESLSAQPTPPNPFQTTLDDLEGGQRKQINATEPELSKRASVQPSSSGSRASMDVDAFKRLLMTGNAAALPQKNPTTPPAYAHPASGILGDSGSSTDTSSISRQSIFDPTREPSYDTPRTSHEMTPSDDDTQRLVEAGQGPEKRKRPPPPKTRHGKLIKAASQQPPSSYRSTRSPTSIASARPPSIDEEPPQSMLSPRSPTNLNKPLPAPPVATTPESEEGYEPSIESRSEYSLKDVPLSTSPSRRRDPPTVPLARRHSQMSKPAPSASSVALGPSIGNEPEVQSTSNEASETKAPKRASIPPPPPPTRKAGPGSGLPPSIASSTYSNQSTHSSLFEPVQSSMESATTKLNAPPLPPSRSSSISSTKRPTQVTAALKSSKASSPPNSAMDPPPPPPRRRGSSKSSVETYLRSDEGSIRRASEYSTDNGSDIAPLASTAESKDILADLSALQREVDELRGKYENRTGTN